ncbi:DUF1376 domain-containing protein [Methylobacterium sp. D53M]
MAAFPALPLFTDAFIGDTTHLNAEETGAYVMLLLTAWRTPTCCLPDDDVKLARSARVTIARWAKIKPTVMAFWTLKDGIYTQKRLTATRDGVSKRANAARENGKIGGRPKSLKDNDLDNPTGSCGVSGSKASISKTKTNVETLPQREPEGPVATRLDPDWELDQALFDAAIAQGLSRDRVPHEAGQFRDWHLDRGAVSFDWLAAWRRWCRNASQRDPHPQPPRRRSEPPMSSDTANLLRLAEKFRTEQSPGDASHAAGSGSDDDLIIVEVDDEDGGGEPGGGRGEDRDVPWQAGSPSRPSDALLRAAGQGGVDHRAAAALRRQRTPRA